jgi:hypothetical protein
MPGGAGKDSCVRADSLHDYQAHDRRQDDQDPKDVSHCFHLHERVWQHPVVAALGGKTIRLDGALRRPRRAQLVNSEFEIQVISCEE